MSVQRVGSFGIWIALILFAVLASPPAAPDADTVIVKMLTGQLADVNLSLFALFNLMGVLPVAFVALLAFDSSAQRVPKWPFLLAGFALGAFALLPYLFLRRWDLPRREIFGVGLRTLASRWFGAVLVLAALALVVLFAFGDVRAFVTLLRTQQFACVMSADFVASTLAGALLSAEEARLKQQPLLKWLGRVPALGLPLVLMLRKR